MQTGWARRWSFSFGVFLVSLALSLGAAEWFSRRFLPEVGGNFVVKLNEASSRYHHPLTPPVPEPDAGAFRILFLGDSFTYGYNALSESFPALVERAFREGAVAGIEPRQVQSLNLGTVSYSPSIYGVLLRDFAPKLKPHLVVIAVDDSDPQDDLLYSPGVDRDRGGLPLRAYPWVPGVPSLLIPLARESKFARSLAYHASRWSEQDPFEDHPEAALVKPEMRFGHYLPGAEQAWETAFRRSLDLVSAMVRYCRERGIGVVWVNYPYPPAVSMEVGLSWRRHFLMDASRVYEPLFHAWQRRRAEELGVPYYDFTPYLRSLSRLDGIYWEDNGHFTPEGNRHFARELVRFLAPQVGAAAHPVVSSP